MCIYASNQMGAFCMHTHTHSHTNMHFISKLGAKLECPQLLLSYFLIRKIISGISYQSQAFYAYMSVLIENKEEITIERYICMLELRDASTWWRMSYNFRSSCHHSFVSPDKLTFIIH